MMSTTTVIDYDDLVSELAHECLSIHIAPADDAGFDLTPIEEHIEERVCVWQLELWADEHGIERHEAIEHLFETVTDEMARNV